MKTILSLMLLSVLSPTVFARISASPATLRFSQVEVGSTQGLRVLVSNDGNNTVRVSVSSGCFGDFQVTDWCGLDLNPFGSCGIDVRFTPRRAGYQNCNLWITDNDSGNANVSVTGHAVERN